MAPRRMRGRSCAKVAARGKIHKAKPSDAISSTGQRRRRASTRSEESDCRKSAAKAQRNGRASRAEAIQRTSGRGQEKKRESESEDQVDPEQSGVPIDTDHGGKSGQTARGGELNRPVKIVGEANRDWMSASAKANPVAAPASRRPARRLRSASQAMQTSGAEEEGESGVLLDEERNDEQDSAEKGREWRKV